MGEEGAAQRCVGVTSLVWGRWLGRVAGLEQLLSESQNSGLCFYWFCLGAMSIRFLESNWFVWVTQMNHIPMHIDYDRNVDWVSTQVRDSHL